MLSKYVMPGNKLELQAVESELLLDAEEEAVEQEGRQEGEIVGGINTKKVYHTVVYDVLSDERLEIYIDRKSVV